VKDREALDAPAGRLSQCSTFPRLVFQKRASHEHPVILQIQPGRAGHRRRRAGPRDQPRAGPALGHGRQKWQTSLSIYAYLPTIGGTTSFPDAARQPQPGINVDASTIIETI
jgi:hypothetical protein